MSADATVVSVGDVMLGDSSICVGFGFRSRCDDAGALAALLAPARPLLAGDVVVGNLETPLTDGGRAGTRWRREQMRGRPGYARALADAGFTHLCVANNHAVQHGVDAFHETVAHLRATGIEALGVRGTGPWSCEPARAATAAGVVGLLAYCRRPRQYATDEPPFAEGTPERILADVARLRDEVAHVHVSLHWGEEFVGVPAREEVDFARALADAGATMVVGHHPHVRRPVELAGGRVVAYSLGNFVTDMVWQAPLREGLVLRCRLDADGLREASARRVRVGDDFAPVPGAEVALVAPAAVDAMALAPAAYRAAVDDTVARQRLASYGFAARNAWRFPPAVLAELATTTVRNKLAAVGTTLRGGGR